MKKKLILIAATMLCTTNLVTFGGTIPKIYLNGNKLLIQQSPIEKQGTTYVPLRAVENLGATVTWNNETQIATITHEYNTIEQRIGSNTALVNSKAVSIPAPAIKHNGVTYIPIRFVSETLGATLECDAKANTISISYEMPKDGNQKYDQFGRLLRSSNLPKNYTLYPNIVAGVPNDMYEFKFKYELGTSFVELVDGRHYKKPTTFVNDEWYSTDNMKLWVDTTESYLDHVLNVDYRTIDYTWADRVAELTCQKGLDDSYYQSFVNDAREYVDYVKANKIIIEGDYYVEPSATYMSDGGVCMRTWVKFKTNKDTKLFNESATNKAGVWYEGYTDVSLGSQKGGEDGTELVVKSTRIGDPGRKLLVQ